jgi:hypothetical protein
MQIERIASDGVYDYLDVRTPINTKVQYRRKKTGQRVVSRYVGQERFSRTPVWRYIDAAQRERISEILDKEMQGVPKTWGLY